MCTTCGCGAGNVSIEEHEKTHQHSHSDHHHSHDEDHNSRAVVIHHHHYYGQVNIHYHIDENKTLPHHHHEHVQSESSHVDEEAKAEAEPVTSQPDADTVPKTSHSDTTEETQTRMVKIEQDILKENNTIAELNRSFLRQNKITAINLMSSPGSGKTTLLISTLNYLDPHKCSVIEGDQQTTNDADRIRTTGTSAIQVNTGKGCHLDCFSYLSTPTDFLSVPFFRHFSLFILLCQQFLPSLPPFSFSLS